MRVVPRPGGTGIPAEKTGEDLVEESLRKRWRKEERSKEQYFKGRAILADREISSRRAKEAWKTMRKFGRSSTFFYREMTNHKMPNIEENEKEEKKAEEEKENRDTSEDSEENNEIEQKGEGEIENAESEKSKRRREDTSPGLTQSGEELSHLPPPPHELSHQPSPHRELTHLPSPASKLSHLPPPDLLPRLSLPHPLDGEILRPPPPAEELSHSTPTTLTPPGELADTPTPVTRTLTQPVDPAQSPLPPDAHTSPVELTCPHTLPGACTPPMEPAHSPMPPVTLTPPIKLTRTPTAITPADVHTRAPHISTHLTMRALTCLHHLIISLSPYPTCLHHPKTE